MIIALYTLGMKLYGGLIRLASLRNPKAKAMLEGREIDAPRHRGQIEHKVNGALIEDFELVWIHCASLGEFEMARPIAAALQAASSQRHVLFSFFSPSGYNHAVLDTNQTKVYLPLDGRDSAKRWHAQWQPQAAIFIRYEFWYHHLKTTLAANIPVFALGVSLTPNHFLFSTLASPWKNLLVQFQAIGLINESMLGLAHRNGLNNAFVFGDSKFNRAFDRTRQTPAPHPILTPWLTQRPTLILGSAWMPEIQLLKSFMRAQPQALIDWQILIAPHDISPEFCGKITEELSFLQPVKFTQGIPHPEETHVVILDTIGQLAESYRNGSIALIGGAFGKGLHNIIEAAAFGLPVIFGPNHHKFPEAQQFIEAGFGFSVEDEAAFEKTMLQVINTLNAPNLAEKSPSQHAPNLKTLASTFVAEHKADIEKFVNLTYPNALQKG